MSARNVSRGWCAVLWWGGGLMLGLNVSLAIAGRADVLGWALTVAITWSAAAETWLRPWALDRLPPSRSRGRGET